MMAQKPSLRLIKKVERRRQHLIETHLKQLILDSQAIRRCMSYLEDELLKDYEQERHAPKSSDNA